MWIADDRAAKVARDEGLTVYAGDPTAAASSDPPPELDGVENAFVMTGDDGFNAMLAADLGEYYGRGDVYQLATSEEDDTGFYVRARVLFDESASHEELDSRLGRGARIEILEGWLRNGAAEREAAIPMFVLKANQGLRILTAGEKPELEPGDELIGLVHPSGPQCR